MHSSVHLAAQALLTCGLGLAAAGLAFGQSSTRPNDVQRTSPSQPAPADRSGADRPTQPGGVNNSRDNTTPPSGSGDRNTGTGQSTTPPAGGTQTPDRPTQPGGVNNSRDHTTPPSGSGDRNTGSGRGTTPPAGGTQTPDQPRQGGGVNSGRGSSSPPPGPADRR